MSGCGRPYLRPGASPAVVRIGRWQAAPMQSHAAQIQAILERELDEHRRQVQLVRASPLTAPPRSQGIAVAGAGAQASR
jgi:hypothetical protein